MKNWKKYLNEFDATVLNKLGYGRDYIPSSSNVICDALKTQPEFLEQIKDIDGYSMIALSRLATLCQMVVYDWNGGPEGDYKQKGLRRHWYQWYKVHFAQPFSAQLKVLELGANRAKIDSLDQENPKYVDLYKKLQKARKSIMEKYDANNPDWGLNWSGRLSETYAFFVDNFDITYRDLWVEDASRMMKGFYQKLFEGCHIVLAVEKDSLLSDFVEVAQRIGATAVYSGKGKSSKAAIELMLRNHFYWYSDDDSPFSEDEPLIILHISDHDFDGEAVIGPTFGQQARRYTGHILEARVGIKPEQVDDKINDWYTVKTSNSGYVEWASQKALFAATCEECGETYAVVGLDEEQDQTCPRCGGWHEAVEIEEDDPHGFEVEAINTAKYYPLIVDALLEVLDFDFIVKKLRDECQADPNSAAETVTRDILSRNEDYQALTKEINRLQEIQLSFESRITNDLIEYCEPEIDSWWDLEDDPNAEDFRQHAVDGWQPWRPFSERARTEKLIEWLREDQEDYIDELSEREIDWKLRDDDENLDE